jgi:DNA-binding ferritin-like protein
MFDTRNDLPAGKRSKVITVLNARLADAIDLAAQTKHAHCNVKGPNFIAHADTADLFTGISRASDKYLWFLEAHLYAKR